MESSYPSGVQGNLHIQPHAEQNGDETDPPGRFFASAGNTSAPCWQWAPQVMQKLARRSEVLQYNQ